ncbi:restriction endonuclease [Streptomyces sp. NPDC051597]|uniref:restriction endonuclease n=1 Tax=Streptomyces sp. NPDC051597 TaxID=3155049 RepID=UPI00341568EE
MGPLAGDKPVSRRYPARRRPRRPSRRGRQGDQLLIGAAVVVGALTLVVTLVRWLVAHWWVLLVVAVAAAAVTVAWLYQRAQAARWAQVRARGLRFAMSQLDALHHRAFEHAVRDLMHRDGCGDAQQVGGAGDRGVDVTATDPYGRRWVIQCKHRKNGEHGSAIGTPDLQRLNGTARPLHGADVVVIVTNGRFSSQCPPMAKSMDIHLVVRRTLGEWAAGGRPLWELLRVPPPRNRRGQE